MKVYLAGPEVFLPNAREILDRKIALTSAYGFAPVAPGDLKVSPALTGKARGLAISAHNEGARALHGSDRVRSLPRHRRQAPAWLTLIPRAMVRHSDSECQRRLRPTNEQARAPARVEASSQQARGPL
jgi:hypothetical protein